MLLKYFPRLAVISLSFFFSCNGQQTLPGKPLSPSKKNTLVGGGCDGCDLMYTGMPENIKATDTSAGWRENGQRLLVTGTVLKAGGKMPAPNIIVYYYHTDDTGLYSKRSDKPQNKTAHGHIRGWVKTDTTGHYEIYTNRPAPYPSDNIPAHVHIVIKEPALNEYYIDELVFDDDKFLTGQKRKELENRGGSGILRVLIDKDVQIAEHNIILGLNIPNYPEKIIGEKQSGLRIGEDNPSFTPFHAWGPDKGTRTCPVCKYGRYQGIIYFAGHNANWADIKMWLKILAEKNTGRNKYLKVFFVYGNPVNYNKEGRQTELEQIGKQLNLNNIALTFVPSFTDTESEVHLNKINPLVESTFIIYRQSTIVDKFIDLKPTPDNAELITTALNRNDSKYFNLPGPKHE